MIDRMVLTLTLATALGSGLIGGVFFAFSNFVMPALARISPGAGLAAMRSINIVVLNPGFLGIFAGTAVVGGLLVLTALFRWSEPGSLWLIAGCILYVFGTFVVTMAFNVPLNNALEALNPAGSEAEAFWQRYLVDWTFWNHVRTLAAVAGAAALSMAFALQVRGPVIG